MPLMGKVTEVQHRLNARRWVNDQNLTHAKMKEDRKTVLSSVKEQIVQKTIHKIEAEVRLTQQVVPRSVFGGFTHPWKKG